MCCFYVGLVSNFVIIYGAVNFHLSIFVELAVVAMDIQEFAERSEDDLGVAVVLYSFNDLELLIGLWVKVDKFGKLALEECVCPLWSTLVFFLFHVVEIVI